MASLPPTALLGDRTVYASTDRVIAGESEAFPFQALASGASGAAHLYIDSANTATTLIVGLYTNQNGHPGSLLTMGALPFPRASVWNTVPLPGTQLASGSTYWLAVLGTGGVLRYRDRASGPCKSQTSAETNLGGLSALWRPGTFWRTCPLSGYVTRASNFPVGPPTPIEPELPPIEPEPPAPLPAPGNIAPPAIAGSAVEGQQLTATSGNWSGSPTSYAYHWQDCDAAGANCTSISGAGSSSYTLASSDVGHTVAVVVTAANAGGSAWARSAPTATVAAAPTPPASPPVNTTLPAVSGSAVQGQTLTSTNGAWSGSPTSYARQWQRCNSAGEACSNLAGATGSTYKLGASDVGHTLRAVVTASNANGATTATSASAGPVIAPPPAASFTYSPAPPVAGQPVTFDATGSSCPAGPCEYAWSDDGGTVRPVPPQWPLGAGQTLQFTFSSPGTKYVRLVVTDASGRTATVEHDVVVESSPPPPPTAPANTAAPTVSGSPQVGQTLTAGSGSWSGSAPITDTYQWRDCDEAGASCANVKGATSPSYKLTEADAGHTLRVRVTAANSAGSAQQDSAPTAVVSAAASVCSVTVSAGMSAAAIVGAVVGAADGGVVCLAGGSYPALTVIGAAHSGYVTVRGAPGATPTVAGMRIANSSFLRVEGLRFSEGVNAADGVGGASHDLQFVDNTFEDASYGIVVNGNGAPITRVLIEGNYFHHLDFPGTCSSGAGYAGGQGVTNYYGDGITVSHNTFKEVSWHYIQGGGASLGMTVDHNLFEGPIPPAHASCTHLNVWQIWDGGRNDTFSNNIVRGEPGKPAAVTPLMFETGAAGAECAKSMTNTTVTNNLFVYSSTAYAVQILTTANLTYSHNTVVGGEYGTWLDRSDTCGPGSNLAAEHNIAVATQSKGSPQRLIIGACTGSCAVDYNVTDDNSAQGPHSLTGWTPRWQSTSYGNAGYYIPTPGLPNPAGYRGAGGRSRQNQGKART